MLAHRKIAIVGVVGLASCLAACGGSSTPTSSSGITGLSASQVLARTKSAVLQQGSVHIQVRGSAKGTNATFSEDSGRSEGRQDITVGSNHAQVVLVSGVAYIEGDQQTLQNFFGLSPAASARGAGKWIAIHSSDPQYKDVTSGVTLSSALDQILPTGTLTKQTVAAVQGRQVVAVHGQLPNSPPGTLYVAATGNPLPVEETAGDSTGTETVTFSNWGESISLSAPAGSVTISSLGA